MARTIDAVRDRTRTEQQESASSPPPPASLPARGVGVGFPMTASGVTPRRSGVRNNSGWMDGRAVTAVSTLPLVETSEAPQPAFEAQSAAPGHLLRLMPAGVTLRSRPGEVILDTLRRCGYAHRYGCRRGGCGVCRIDLLVGETIDAALISESVLSPGDRRAGVRLSCRAIPAADVVLGVRPDDELRCVSSFLLRYSNEKGSHPCP